MDEKNARPLALAGVFGAAIIATFLLTPAMYRLSRIDGLWPGMAIMIVPTAAVLTATGYRYYGLWRSLGVAVGVVLLTLTITWAIAVFMLAVATAESPATVVVDIVLYATPATCVVVFALLAMRLVSSTEVR
jgi:hypothetical protein